MIGSPGAQEAQKRQAVLVGYGVKLGTTKTADAQTRSRPRPRQRRRSQRPSAPAPARPQPHPLASAACLAVSELATGLSVLAKPPVRKLAKDLGVDLTAVTGTGTDGVITRDDVQAAATGPRRQPRPASLVRARDGTASARSASRSGACASTWRPR